MHESSHHDFYQVTGFTVIFFYTLFLQVLMYVSEDTGRAGPNRIRKKACPVGPARTNCCLQEFDYENPKKLKNSLWTYIGDQQ